MRDAGLTRAAKKAMKQITMRSIVANWIIDRDGRGDGLIVEEVFGGWVCVMMDVEG